MTENLFWLKLFCNSRRKNKRQFQVGICLNYFFNTWQNWSEQTANLIFFTSAKVNFAPKSLHNYLVGVLSFQPGHGLVRHWGLLHSRVTSLQGCPHVHQGPGPGGGIVQIGHVPKVWAQETMVCQGMQMFLLISIFLQSVFRMLFSSIRDPYRVPHALIWFSMNNI